MDPISHVLLGRTIGCVDESRSLGPGSRAALVLGALAPDIDIVIAVQGWDRYLHWHEMGTHALAASPVLALAVAGVVRAIVQHSRFVRLWWAAWAGVVVGHLAFDLISGSDMRLFEPWVHVRLSPHWLAMADLSAVAILIGGTVWSRWRKRLAAVWTIAALAAIVAVKAVSQQIAVGAFARGRAAEAGIATVPDAINASLFGWMFFERDELRARAWKVDALTGGVTPAFEWPIPGDAATIGGTAELPVVQTFLELARVPFPRVDERDGRRWILWSDLRQCNATRCDLSFGVEIDAQGRPIRQVIRIGTFDQTRSLPGR